MTLDVSHRGKNTRLAVFENTVPWTIFGPMRQCFIRFDKLHSDGLHNSVSSTIFRANKTRKNLQVEKVALVGSAY
jgi:hypothetical protein